MRYAMTKFWVCAAASALCVLHVNAQAPVAVLNALQLPIEDLDLGIGKPAAAPAVAPAPAPVAVVDAPPVAPVEIPVAVEAPAVAEAPLAPAAPRAVATAPALPDAIAVTVSEMEALERVRREATDRHGLGALAQAQAAMGRGSYEEAIKLYQDALDYIGDRPSNAIARRDAENGLMEAYYRHALLLQQRTNLKDAYSAAIAARRAGHPKAEALVLEIDNLIKNPPVPPPAKVEKRWNEPAYQANQDKITGHMSRAREFYATGEYDRCREQLELIMRENPFNTEAIAMLQKLGARRYDVADAEFEATRREMIHEVKSIWTPRNYAKDMTDIGGDRLREGSATNAPSTEGVRIQDKMRRIIIPEINFRQANLTDVITFLGDASREYDDPSVPADQRGINIIIQLQSQSGPAVGAAPAAPLDPFAAPADAGAGAAAGDGQPITFQARYVTLYDALSIVMNLADLKFRIRGNVVMVMRSSAADSELLHRMYNVLPTLVDRMATFRTERQGSGAVGDPFGMTTANIESQSDWKAFFKDLGVNWPDESSIQHMPTIGKLVVRNTSENLATLETVLAVLNVTPKQVEIEARFVEVMQGDLESLGFEWILNNDWEIMENKKDVGLPMDARQRIAIEKGSINSGFGYLSSQGVAGDTAIADNILTVSSVLTNPELSMVLHMLSQRKNTDLLSAPKVVTKNGSEATIKVVTEYIYPTEFTVQGLQSTSGNNNTSTTTGAVVEPGGFETREVGVILQVVPDVTPDGQMINLTLAPQVVSDPIWKNYGSTYTDGNGNPQQLNMEQPFFPVRSIATSIQIYNGATVVMGGMITEVRQANEDKIPLLGDIPVIGRLFRYKYDSSEKRNLLIFVTAKLVDPAGRVVRDRQDLPMLPIAAAALPKAP